MKPLLAACLLAVIAPFARADMTETGTIVGQSSITASAFFGDGSHLTGVSSHAVLSSTHTVGFINASQTVSCSAPITCFSGSTLTWTATGGGSGYWITFAGSADTSVSNTDFGVGYLLDGVPPPNSAQQNVGMVVSNRSITNGGFPQQTMSFSLFIPDALSAGSHSICLSGCSGGSGTIALGGYSYFGVVEVP